MLSKVLKITDKKFSWGSSQTKQLYTDRQIEKKAKSNRINKHCTTKYKLTFLSEDELKTNPAILSSHHS